MERIDVYKVIGNKGGSLASIQIMNLIKSRYDGKIFPIHLELDSVMGFKAYKNISELPEIPDLVVITTRLWPFLTLDYFKFNLVIFI